MQNLEFRVQQPKTVNKFLMVLHKNLFMKQ